MAFRAEQRAHDNKEPPPLAWTTLLRGLKPEAASDEDGQTVVRQRKNSDGSGPWVWLQKRGWLSVDLSKNNGVDVATWLNTKANQRDGACIEITDGGSNLNAPVVMNREGTTITGPERGFSHSHEIFNNGYTTSGALLNIKHTGKAFDIQQPNCRVMNLQIDYPDQVLNPATTALGAVTAYDYTFWIPNYAHGTTVRNITCHRTYKFLYFSPNGGLIEHIKVFPLLRGFTFPRCGAAPHCSDIQINPVGSYRDGAGLAPWAKANCVAYMMDGVEGYYFDNCNIFGCNTGVWFADEDGDGFTGVYGTWVAPDFEACNTVIRIDNDNRTYCPLANIGGKFLGGQMVPEIGGYGVDMADTATPANYNNRPKIWLLGTTMHSSPAGMSRGVWMRSGSAGRVIWMPGEISQVANEVVRNDSTAGGVVKLVNVDSPTGVTRAAGAGRIESSFSEIRS